MIVRWRMLRFYGKQEKKLRSKCFLIKFTNGEREWHSHSGFMVGTDDLEVACQMFDKKSGKNVIYWTKKISEYARKGLNEQAISCFTLMREVSVEPNVTTFSVVIGICCTLRRINLGKELHSLSLRKGYLSSLFVSTDLIKLYSNCHSIDDAHKVFVEMPERDSVAWNSMISAYTLVGICEKAIDLFLKLLSNKRWRFLANDFTFATVLKACSTLGCIRIGKIIHSYVITLGYSLDVILSGALIDMYAKCGFLSEAHDVFSRMSLRDLVIWNAMITGCAQNYYEEEAIELFCQLGLEGFAPNHTTFTCMLKVVASMGDKDLGMSFHAKTINHGCLSDVFVGTALIDMYSKCLDLDSAERVFYQMTKRNLVSFNSLITGLSLVGRYEEALKFYIMLIRENLKPCPFTFTGLFSSFGKSGLLVESSQIQGHSIKLGLDSNSSVGSALTNLYSKSGDVDNALKSFRSITELNSVSWAGIISCFVQNGCGEKALEYFCKMHRLDEKPDEFCISSTLKGLTEAKTMEHGRHVHGYAIKSGLDLSEFVGTGLIDLYSKYGMVEDSIKVFENMPEKNIVTWNSLIMGLAQNGSSDRSLELFKALEHTGLKPTAITFIAALCACSHAGFINEAKNIFSEMTSTYGILPCLEHYTCMIDLFGRSGNLEEAESLISNSDFVLESGLWKSLLVACAIHKNTEVGRRAAKKCLQLDPDESSTYVLLSNIYASQHSWSDVMLLRNLMKEMGVQKEPGCSWIRF